jgi:hypothetical protein
MLGLAADFEVAYDFEPLRIDDIDPVAAGIRHIDVGRETLHHWAELVGVVGGIDVFGIQNRRHSWQRSIDHGWIGEQKQHELAEHELYVQAIKFTKTGKAHDAQNEALTGVIGSCSPGHTLGSNAP